MICEIENCSKRASYAYYYGKGERCKDHKEDRKKHQSICVCGKAQPIFNYPNETTPICCFQCKKEGMEDVKNKKCQCGKARPSFNYPNKTKGICCVSCKKEGMKNVVDKKCQCGKW